MRSIPLQAMLAYADMTLLLAGMTNWLLVESGVPRSTIILRIAVAAPKIHVLHGHNGKASEHNDAECVKIPHSIRQQQSPEVPEDGKNQRPKHMPGRQVFAHPQAAAGISIVAIGCM
mmetsp:Transcript_254/g.362  ORF Transcript_254/g.362 Transcript_254/m.362 type:complete len:117 (+) Transcript_254:96-446(+)